MGGNWGDNAASPKKLKKVALGQKTRMQSVHLKMAIVNTIFVLLDILQIDKFPAVPMSVLYVSEKCIKKTICLSLLK